MTLDIPNQSLSVFCSNKGNCFTADPWLQTPGLERVGLGLDSSSPKPHPLPSAAIPGAMPCRAQL